MIPGSSALFRAGSLPPSVTFTDRDVQTTNLSTYTFSSQDFGTAKTGRIIVVGIRGWRDKGGTVSSVTIGGVSATIHENQSQAFGSTAMASAVVPTGTTGNVVVTWSISQSQCEIKVWSILDATSSTPTISITDITDPLSSSPTFGARRVVVAHAKNLNTGTYTWVGLTENDDTVAPTTGFTHSAASGQFLAAVSAHPITATHSNTFTTGSLQYLVFR